MIRSRRPRRRALMVAAALTLVVAGAATASTAQAGDGCRDVRVPVKIEGASGDIGGELCAPPSAATVQLLVHGFTYGQYYWDFPYQPKRYSYVRRAAKAGYATLNIDRMGTGDSFHPPGALLTYDNHAATVHQVVQALRKGLLGGAFGKVVLVGHSYGTMTSYLEAGRYQDVDAIVATGAAHRGDGPEMITKVPAKTIPAMLDPKYEDSGYDPSYGTTKPGARKGFYHPPNADPRVIALDERLKGTGNHVELVTSATYLVRQESKRINLPVLTVLGSEDSMFCSPTAADCSSDAALAEMERGYFGPDAISEAYVVPNTGHNVNLEFTAQRAYDRILDFLDRHVGPRNAPPE